MQSANDIPHFMWPAIVKRIPIPSVDNWHEQHHCTVEVFANNNLCRHKNILIDHDPSDGFATSNVHCPIIEGSVDHINQNAIEHC